MFGYITTNMDELKIKDYKKYRAFYCGICQDLKEYHGQISRLSLTYDMTFMAVLLTGLYETMPTKEKHFCALHPVKKHLCYRNDLTAYAADMNVLLSFYNMRDDWEDEKKIGGLLLSGIVKKDVLRLQEKYPRQTEAIKEYLQKLHVCEKENSNNLDRASGDTGQLFAEIFVLKEDCWADILRKIGYALGKYIYLMDAFDDLEKDRKTGNYNPWMFISQEEDFELRVKQILIMIAAEASRQFEKLPIIEYVDILRNVLYSGMWMRFDNIVKKKCSEKEK